MIEQRIGPRSLRRGRVAIGAAIVAGVALAALCAPWLAHHDPLAQDLLARRQPPSARHPLGQDELGRDNLSRVIYGARVSLPIGLGAVLLALSVGLPLGAAAGYLGGLPDAAITGIMDVWLAFPSLLLALAIVAALGQSVDNLICAVALGQVPTYARLMRIGVLATKERGYVLAARSIGASPGRLLTRHILPNCVGSVLTQALLGIGTAILEAAGLSFLGLGIRPPTPEWGAMIAQGKGAVFTAPHILLAPGLAILLTVLGFNLLGSGWRNP